MEDYLKKRKENRKSLEKFGNSDHLHLYYISHIVSIILTVLNYHCSIKLLVFTLTGISDREHCLSGCP